MYFDWLAVVRLGRYNARDLTLLWTFTIAHANMEQLYVKSVLFAWPVTTGESKKKNSIADEGLPFDKVVKTAFRATSSAENLRIF